MGVRVYALGKGLVIKELPMIQEEDSLDSVSRKLPQGLYSTFRTYSGAKKVVGLQIHLNRLVSNNDLDIQPSATLDEIRQGLRIIFRDFEDTEARVRISLSLSEQPGQIFMMAEKLKPIDEKLYQNGVNVVTSLIKRVNPRLKSTTFIQESEKERISLLNKGIYEALIVRNGRILEGLTSNFYAVKNSKIVTAQDDILLGVTRRMILRLFHKYKLPVEFRKLRIGEISGIDEAFITSSSRGVVPVINIDGIQIGQGIPGGTAKQLRKAYDDYVLEKAETI